jgi:type IV pilus assembly protein PilA
MIVVAIIGILAAIAIPQFTRYRAKGYMAQIRSDVRNAYTAANSYFADNPAAAGIALADIQANGYQATAGVAVAVTSGTANTFSLSGSNTAGNVNGTYVMQAPAAIVVDTLAAP